ncbi:MAG: ABC transporter ATP-binding protein [Alphaproteobacteria bacterium]|nr:ABC transporter ATP-binding protein [Alphaproteobacteria bacterium]
MTPNATAKLIVKDLRKTYGPVVALTDASIEVREGEFLTLLGPSGSGKTTMLMVIAGLVQPDSGEVWIDGKLATYAPSFKRDLGMVFQNYALFPHMTVAENIAFPLRMRRLGQADIAREVKRVLDIVRLPHVADRLPRALSGGQQQRIALARCIVYGPSIILMDEPLGALDKKLRDEMQLEIKRLHTELGITVLYVTHDQEEAMVMSDRICLMNDARIEQLGTPADLYFRPRTLFAAGFLGESNILDATVTAVENGRAVLRLAVGDDALVRAVARDGVKPGQSVKLMVRPECLTVLGQGERAENEIQAGLKDVIMVGGITKHYARLPDGKEVVAANLTRGPVAQAAAGEALRLGWSADSSVLLV